MEKKIALLVNRKAGKGKAISISAEISGLLQTHSIPFQSFEDIWPPELSGFTDIFLVGGDGTLNYFINKYTNLTVPISVFKGGSGNDFAWKLSGDTSVAEMVRYALQSNYRKVDLGLCNGRRFVNGVGIGFDGKIVESMGARRFLSAGHLSYYVAVLKNILFFRSYQLKIVTNAKELEGRYFMISIANGSRYGGGFLVAPRAKIDDGLFNVVAIRAIHPLSRIRHLPKVSAGKHLNLSFITEQLSDSVIIRSEKALPAHIDGDYTVSREFHIQMFPGLLIFTSNQD